jgi:hypothetical protein
LIRELNIPKDSYCKISSSPLGTGTIQITLGSSNEFLKDGDTIKGIDSKSMMESISESINPTIENVNKTIKSLDSTIKKIGTDNVGFNDAGAKKEGNAFSQPVAELDITPELRQTAFDKQTTTDDHGMHIVGTSTEKNGGTYFLVKNSWGTENALGGYFYVSESYFRYKTISVMLHKDAIEKGTSKKLGL